MLLSSWKASRFFMNRARTHTINRYSATTTAMVAGATMSAAHRTNLNAMPPAAN